MTDTTNPDAVVALPNAGHDSRVRAFRAGKTVDSFAIITDRFLILVDTLVSPEAIQAAMDHLSDVRDRPLLVINTHGDWDHTWGNALFSGPRAREPAPIIGHRIAAERMRSEDAQAYTAAAKVKSPGRYDSVEIRPPTVLFEGELAIEGGDLTLRLVPTPGHTPDHVAVWIPELRLLLAGDAAELPMPYVADWRTLPELRATLVRLLDLEPQTVLYCHAPGVSSPNVIRHNVAYFDELEQRCRDLLAQGAVDPEIDEVEDPAALLAWPLEEALPPGTTMEDLPSIAFYRASHNRAIRAMIRWLTSQEAARPR